jgi:hypothetical protein
MCKSLTKTSNNVHVNKRIKEIEIERNWKHKDFILGFFFIPHKKVFASQDTSREQ